MLIGVMEHAAEDQGDFSLFGHQCEVLQRCDLLPQTDQRSSLALILKTLITFKERWLLARQFLLPFDIGQSTGLCPDVLVEITKYLSLNDAINAFSITILPLLRQAHSKVHFINPSSQFLEIIPDQLDPSQVASVRMTGDLQRPERDLSAFQIFDQLSNLTVVSERGTHTLSQLLRYLPNVRRLSFWLDVEFNSQLFRDLQDLSVHSITHLHIHCRSICSNRFWAGIQNTLDIKNTTITSLIFDLTYNPVSQTISYFLRSQGYLYLALFNPPTNSTGSLTNIQRVRLIVSRDLIETFLPVYQWKRLIEECPRLDRVIIQLVGTGKFTQEALSIEQELRQLRPGMIFRIKNA